MAFFSEINARLGLDISEFEKGMLDANRAAKKSADAQAKLADFRRNKALEEATDLNKIKILQGELVQLYNLRKIAIAGSAPYLSTQLEIEKKMVEIGRVRVTQKQAEASASASVAASDASFTKSIQKKVAASSGAAGGQIASGVAGAATGGFLSRNASKGLGLIKSIGGKLGLGGVLAGLFPEAAGVATAAAGAGTAAAAAPAVAVAAAIAGIVYGYKKINEYIDNIAERTKQITELMAESGQRTRDSLLKSLDKDPKKKLKFLQDEADQASLNFKIAYATSINEEGDLKTLKAKAASEKANIALQEHKTTMQEAAANDAASEEEQIKAINDQRNKSLSDELKKKYGIKYLQMSLAEAEKEANKNGLTKLQLAKANLAVDEARDNLSKFTAEEEANLSKLEAEKQDKIDTAVKATDKVREDALNETLTLEQQILLAKAKVYDLEIDVNESKKGSVNQTKAGLALEQEKANLSKLEKEQSHRQTAAEQQRTDKLKDQLKTLQDQKTTIEQTLAAQAKGAKASIDDIASGKRQVGGTTKVNAQKLLAARSEEQRRTDAVSQAEDTLANNGKPLTASAKKDAEAELNRRKKALAETLGRKGKLEGALKDKTSDTLAAEQVVELKNVVAEIIKTNKALAPTSITSNT